MSVIARVLKNPKRLLSKRVLYAARELVAPRKNESRERRDYRSYEEYVEHQVSKLDAMVKSGTANRDAKSLAMFRRRFEQLPLSTPSSIICLGARLGNEVEAFISLGHFAVGIDLNPGPQNPYVMYGDFHDLKFGERSVDCVYTNSLDHALDLGAICNEVRRVLKPGGLFVLDAVYGESEGYSFGARDCFRWKRADDLANEIAATGFTISRREDLTIKGSPLWVQFLMRVD